MTSRRAVAAALAAVALLAAALSAFGVLQIAENAAGGRVTPLEAWLTAFALGLTALVLPAAVGWQAFRSLDRQVESLTEGVDAVAAGAPARTFVVASSGSAGDLASALTRLVRGYTEQVDEGRRESFLLQSVVGAMKEGMVVLGPDRKIRVANDAFRQLFRTPFDPVGRLLAEVVRDPAVFRELESALPSGGAVRESLFHMPGSGRTFELRVSPLASRQTDEPSGALILFFDVTRLEALERVRRDFVADVSHELRTPLTSIKAFVENLLEERIEDRAESLKFLEIVRKHADRMSALIDDLTDLSQIETGAVKLDLSQVDAAEVAHEVAAQLGLRARAASVDLGVDLDTPFPLTADRRRLEQILVNLIDNAIKFNRPGGSVRIGGAVRDGRPIVTVEDTGVGIPSDQVEQVFHRFFRVDKARSRELGGTGLGLAIVKHLMRLHGGQITVTSELGRGSVFSLEFPPVVARGPRDQGVSAGTRSSSLGGEG